MAKLTDAVIAEKNAKVKKSSNRLLAGILLLFFGGYFIFFSSNTWMPPVYEDITVTPIGQTAAQSGRKITLLSWTWDEETRTQEIMLEIQNASTDGIDRYAYEVKDMNKGSLELETACETSDFVVLRLTDLPNRWTALSLRITLPSEDTAQRESEEESFALVKMYTTKDAVDRAEIGAKQSETAYRSMACDIRIAALNSQIDQYLAEMKDCKDTISNAKKRIQKLEAESKWQTETEQAETLSAITELKGAQRAAEASQEDAAIKIQELQAQIKMQEKLQEKYTGAR